MSSQTCAAVSKSRDTSLTSSSFTNTPRNPGTKHALRQYWALCTTRVGRYSSTAMRYGSTVQYVVRAYAEHKLCQYSTGVGIAVPPYAISVTGIA
eukprot:860090-Rhodomonas_salina.1